MSSRFLIVWLLLDLSQLIRGTQRASQEYQMKDDEQIARNFYYRKTTVLSARCQRILVIVIQINLTSFSPKTRAKQNI